MRAGKLDKRITLQQPVKAPDGRGGYTTRWSDVATVWAEFKKPNLETKELTGAVASVALQEIKIRYRTDVVKGWQVKYGSKVFPIDHVYDIGKVEMFLVCKEVVK